MERMLRPEPIVIADVAIIPAANLIVPPPTIFTHEVTHEQSYYYAPLQAPASPAGVLPAGTRVVVLGRDAEYGWVVDGRGLYVLTAWSGLKALHAP